MVMKHLLAITLALLLLVGCQDSSPVKIGFVGELTTRASGLGTSGRDGFLLAIEEINQTGGIDGRLVEPKIQDVHMHKETALNAVKVLVEENVSVIIGPMTSQTAVSILPAINQAKIPMISPTASTNQLSGLNDYFLRVYYTNAQAAQLLASRLAAMNNGRHIAAIYDLSNKAYTADWVQHFQDTLEKIGNATVSHIPFDLRSDTLFADLVDQAISKQPDGILILANAVDTAMICQQLKKIEVDIPRYATGWSYSDDLIQFGGKSVEGLMIIQSANLSDPQSSVREFATKYRERFRAEPNFPAMHAYDATRLALSALQQSTDPEKIRSYVLGLQQFRGVQSDLALDTYGDLRNPKLHLAKIIDGQFVVVD